MKQQEMFQIYLKALYEKLPKDIMEKVFDRMLSNAIKGIRTIIISDADLGIELDTLRIIQQILLAEKYSVKITSHRSGNGNDPLNRIVYNNLIIDLNPEYNI